MILELGDGITYQVVLPQSLRLQVLMYYIANLIIWESIKPNHEFKNGSTGQDYGRYSKMDTQL